MRKHLEKMPFLKNKKANAYGVFLLPLALFLLGMYFIFCPFFQKIFFNPLLIKKKNEKEVLIDELFWDSLSAYWSEWNLSSEPLSLSPDSLVRLAKKHSVSLQQLQVLAEGTEYRFHATASFNAMLQFIRGIERFSPDWTIERFDWTTNTKHDVSFLRNTCIRFNKNDVPLQQVELIQGRELVQKLERWVDFKKRHAKPFEPLEKKTKASNQCHLPPLKITGVIAGRTVHIQSRGEKKIYKPGDMIGNYRVLKIETRQVLFTCAQDTVSRFL